MPPKKKTTKKEKKDFIDFIKEACQRGQPQGKDFLDELNKQGVKAKDLYALLRGWGYEGVRLKDCTKLLSVVDAYGPIQHGGLQRSY